MCACAEGATWTVPVQSCPFCRRGINTPARTGQQVHNIRCELMVGAQGELDQATVCQSAGGYQTDSLPSKQWSIVCVLTSSYLIMIQYCRLLLCSYGLWSPSTPYAKRGSQPVKSRSCCNRCGPLFIEATTRSVACGGTPY